MSNTVDTVVRKGTCPVCGNGCHFNVHVESGRAVKCTPDQESMLGFMCRRGANAVDYHHHPKRLNHPLKRTGASFYRLLALAFTNLSVTAYNQGMTWFYFLDIAHINIKSGLDYRSLRSYNNDFIILVIECRTYSCRRESLIPAIVPNA